MIRFIDWIKHNKLSSLLLLVVVYFLIRNFFSVSSLPLSVSRTATSQLDYEAGTRNEESFSAPAVLKSQGIFPVPEAPPTDVDERLVVQETTLSLVVKDIRQTTNEILNYVEKQDGYMVSTTLTQPEEAPFATIVVRIPTEKLRESLDFFRQRAIKVSSEFISGWDVTDEYVDLEAQLVTLQKTKSRFEEIMDQAFKIDDILQVQREIINLQTQIDSLKGRQQYLEGTAKFSKVTLNLSTDELSLPYAPSDTFRPKVIFKLAVRSLVLNLRKIASAAIWLVVYSVVWLPVLLVVIIFKRWNDKKHLKQEK